MKSSLLLGLSMLLLLVSCGKSEEDIFMEDKAEIVEYLTKKSLLDQAKITESGIYYIISKPGDENKKPSLNSFVKCNYKGYFPDEKVFDENKNSIFRLGQTIEGWRQGIRLIGEGGSIQLFIPSNLGYGTAGTNGIPKNQVLFFDVDLLKVN